MYQFHGLLLTTEDNQSSDTRSYSYIQIELHTVRYYLTAMVPIQVLSNQCHAKYLALFSLRAQFHLYGDQAFKLLLLQSIVLELLTHLHQAQV